MLNDIGQVIWNSKYANPNEDYLSGCKRVVHITDGFFSDSEQQQLFVYLAQQKFSPGGRIWYSAGKPKPQYANCALFDVEDSKEGWSKTMQQNVLALTSGMGVGNHVSKVRHKGAYINGLGGTASGTLSVVSMVNEVARHIMQGNTRRSACYSAIHWTHKDVWEWLDIKNWNADYEEMKRKDYNYPAPLDLHNISICYDNSFLEAYNDENHEYHNHAVKLFEEHTARMFMFGDPSIQFDIDDKVLRNA